MDQWARRRRLHIQQLDVCKEIRKKKPKCLTKYADSNSSRHNSQLLRALLAATGKKYNSPSHV